MIKHFTRAQIINEVRRVIQGGTYECEHNGDGRAGALIEDLLGIKVNNTDLADAVGFEIKSSINNSTPVTLFHKEPLPRKPRPGATTRIVHEFGWDSDYHGQTVKSFRATIWGSFKNGMRIINENNERLVLYRESREIAYWDANELVGIASAKLKNMMYIEAKVIKSPNHIKFIDAQLFETFQPFKFLDGIEKGLIAIDFDARTIPGRNSIRNHGTKFRIMEKNLIKLYARVTDLKDL